MWAFKEGSEEKWEKNIEGKHVGRHKLKTVGATFLIILIIIKTLGAKPEVASREFVEAKLNAR